MMVLWMAKGVFHLTMETIYWKFKEGKRHGLGVFTIKMAISMLVTFDGNRWSRLLLIQMVINELVCGNMKRLNNLI